VSARHVPILCPAYYVDTRSAHKLTSSTLKSELPLAAGERRVALRCGATQRSKERASHRRPPQAWPSQM